MLDIVLSFNLVQYQGKLMNHTWKNDKKPILDPILAHLAQIRATKFFFFQKSRLRQTLDIIVTYHHVQYQKKLDWENLATERQTDRQTKVIS